MPEAMESDLQALETYGFPGNVRELQNIIERALIHSDEGGRLHLARFLDSASDLKTAPEDGPAAQFPLLDDAVRLHLTEALRICRGRIQGSQGAEK